jgi:hypothetical protein
MVPVLGSGWKPDFTMDVTCMIPPEPAFFAKIARFNDTKMRILMQRKSV